MGRFTVAGDPALEAGIQEDLDRARTEIEAEFGGRLVSLVLVGGYGRGEGGVVREGGRWKPKNNYDFLIVTRGRGGRKASAEALRALKRRLDPVLQVAFEGSVQAEARVRKAPAIMFFQDVRRASQTLAGREVRELIPASVLEPLPSVEALRVLRTRSILLLACRLEEPHLGYEPTPLQKRIWLAKAVIGFGDAVLILEGAYRTLYREKAEAIQRWEPESWEGVDVPAFRALHLAASRYRLEDAASSLLDDVPGALRVLEPVARQVYARSLERPGLRWEELPDLAVYGGADPLRLVRNALVNLRAYGGPRPWRLLGVHPRDLLVKAVPLLLFHPSPESLACCREELRLASGAGWDAVRDTCLQICGSYLV